MRERSAERQLAPEHAVAPCLAQAECASNGLKTAIRAIRETHGWEAGRYLSGDEQAGLLRFSESWSAPEAA